MQCSLIRCSIITRSDGIQHMYTLYVAPGIRHHYVDPQADAVDAALLFSAPPRPTCSRYEFEASSKSKIETTNVLQSPYLCTFRFLSLLKPIHDINMDTAALAGLGSSCQAALPRLLTSSFATCADVFGLVSVGVVLRVLIDFPG